MMQLWPTQALERHIAMLQDAVKKGISDPDAEARFFSRKYAETTYCLLSVLTVNYVEGFSLTVVPLSLILH